MQVDVPAVIVPLVSRTPVAPETSGLLDASVTVPPQLFAVVALAITRPAGNVSMNPKPLCAGLPAELVMVKVNVAGSPTPIGFGLDVLLSKGGATTVKVALTLLVIPADSPVTLAATLLYVPTVAELTVATIVQLACPKPRKPPASVIVAGGPTVLVTVPPHWLAAGVPISTTFAGNVSTNARLFCCGLPAPLVIVKVNVDGALVGMLVGLNDLARVDPTTFSVSLTFAVRPPANAVILGVPPALVFR